MSSVKNIGTRIKSAREHANNGRGLSQKELAELIRIKQASLSEIEVGKTTPRRPTLIALSFVLNDDFGERWLREFFQSVSNTEPRKFNHALIAELFSSADKLDEKSVAEMQHIWEMLRAEIKRREQ